MDGPLPPAVETLRDAVALGLRSLRPASGIFLAVALVSFVRAGLAEEFFRGYAPGSEASGALSALVSLFVTAAALSVVSLGFVFLIPLQDDLALGRPASERTAAQAVFRRAVPLTVSGLAQAAAVFGPPTVLFVAVATRETRAVLESGGTLDAEALTTIQAAVLHGSLAASCTWLALTNALFLFAVPLVLLENRGPLRSIGLSAGIFVRRVFPDWARFMSVALLWALLYLAVALPESAIVQALARLPRWSFLRSFLPAAWSAASMPFALACGTAGLVVLFRKIVPARA